MAGACGMFKTSIFPKKSIYQYSKYAILFAKLKQYRELVKQGVMQ
jgi:hypothetical protein